MEIMFLAVLPAHSKRGIGLELVKADLQLLDELATSFYGPEVATALFTGRFSQKIGDKLDFQVLGTHQYNMLEYKGAKYCDKIDPIHTGIQLVAKRRGGKSFWAKYFKK